MTDLLAKTIHPDTHAPVQEPVTTERRAGGAPGPPTTPRATPHGPWPRNAKIVVAILAVATVLAALGTFAATRSGDDATVTDQQEQIDTLTAEREQLTADLETATARAAALTAQRDALDDQIATLDADLAIAEAQAGELGTELRTATIDLVELRIERASLTAEREALQTDLAAVETEVADLEFRLDTATDLTATLDERIALLDVQVGYLQDRAVDAEAERDALAALFPIAFDSSLQDVDVTGEWDLRWDEVYCDDFATCGAAPGFSTLTITETPQGWLRASVDGVFDLGLFRVDGALYGITESMTAAPACDGAQRPAHVGITLYASGVTVLDDGTHQIEDLGASYVVDAPATATCPAGVAVYGTSLTAS